MSQHTDAPRLDLPLAAQPDMLDMKGLAEVLIRHFEHHEGHFETTLHLAIALGPVTPGPNSPQVPGAVFGVNGVGLRRVMQPTQNSVDAAIANPKHGAQK